MKFRNPKGYLLIEMVITVALVALILPILLGGFFASRESGPQQKMRLQATALLKETETAVKAVRDGDWSSITTNGTYYTQVQSNAWQLISGTQTLNGLTQAVAISDVRRDDQGRIVQSGGVTDPSTKQVTITISWQIPQPSSVVSTLYLARTDNLTFTETTKTQLNAGTNTGTAVADTTGSSVSDDGQLQLGAGGGADWCAPSLTITALDLPGQGITTDVSAVEGKAFMTTGGNSSGDSMDSVNITGGDPPIASNFSAYNYRKTYEVFTDGTYSYLTSDHPSMMVDIVRVSSTPFTSVGSFVGSSGGKGDSIYVENNVGYVTAGTKLYTFNLSSKTGARSELGNITLNGTGRRVIVVGNYAYVVTSSTTNQLQIVNVSNPSSMSIVRSFSVGNALPGVDLFVTSSGNYVYLVTTYASGKNSFYILDVSNKTSPTILGSYSTNGMTPKGVIAVPGNRAIVVGSGGEQYQVLNVSNLSSPTYCGGLANLNSSTSVNAVTAVTESDGDVYAYILTNNSASEFQIIEGGPGGQFSTSGDFESAPFDANSYGGGNMDHSFNRFEASVIQPSLTDISIQVAVAPYGPSGDCTTSSYVFVGPDGTGSTFFEPDGNSIIATIPLLNSGGYANPGKCFKYKVYLDSDDVSLTPIFNDIIINYSP